MTTREETTMGTTGLARMAPAKERLVSRFTRNYAANLLAKTGGNVTRAAELSGQSRASLQKIMRRLGIKSDGFRKEE